MEMGLLLTHFSRRQMDLVAGSVGTASKIKSAKALGTPRKSFNNLKGVKNNGNGSTTNPLFKKAGGLNQVP